MKFEEPACPSCGKPAVGTKENVPARALFDGDPTQGPVEWSGETTCFWEGQMSERDGDDAIMLECEDAHEWSSTYEEVKDEAKSAVS